MELAYSLNTLYFLLSGVLVMWMAAGFTMLEAGSVRSKNVIEILLKNVALYSTASLGFLLGGYSLMYGWGDIDTHSIYSDFFFQVVFAATAMSVVSGAVAERKKLWTFLLFAASTPTPCALYWVYECCE
jgi:Amt family ammonium transporter